jgi:hypothetical protein
MKALRYTRGIEQDLSMIGSYLVRWLCAASTVNSNLLYTLVKDSVDLWRIYAAKAA